MKLIGIGDSVVDYYKHEGVIYPGGNALNVVVSAKRNGAFSCAYLGMVGDDYEGKHIIGTLKQESIDISRIRQVYGHTGMATISTTAEGDRQFIGTNRKTRVQSLLSLRLNEEDLDYINNYDVIHTSINSNLEHELPKIAQRKISFDFSTSNHWDNTYLEEVCPYINYAFFSGSDMSLKQIHNLIDKVHYFGVDIVGVTRGGESAIFSRAGEIIEQKTLATNIIDTMGAGDSFIGAFLASYLDTEDLKEALHTGARSAALTCECKGAFGYGKRKE